MKRSRGQGGPTDAEAGSDGLFPEPAIIARRRLLLFLGAFALSRSLRVQAQPTQGNTPRIGFLSANANTDSQHLRDAFLAGLRQAGYVDGTSIFIEWRFADRQPERLAGLASELVARRPALIVTETTLAVRAAKQATSTIPIVMTAVADAVGSGLVTNLARPGANVSGMSFLGTELVAKRLELLKYALPALTHVTVLQHLGAHGEATAKHMREETEQAARTLGLSMRVLEVRAASDLPSMFAAMQVHKAGAILVWPSPMFLAERKQITQLALKHKTPAMYYLREYVDAGGLMAYGPSLPDLFRRSAMFVDKILKGTKVGDLPVEQPAKFEFVINLVAGRELGISIPQSLLVLADEVLRP